MTGTTIRSRRGAFDVVRHGCAVRIQPAVAQQREAVQLPQRWRPGGGAPGTPDDLSDVPRRNDEAKYGKYSGGPIAVINNVDEPPTPVHQHRPGGILRPPNPTRGEYVLFGGNPDNKSDHYQVHTYPIGTKPDRNWHPALWNLGISLSDNGLIEYKSDKFGGALKGKILTTGYSGMKDVEVIALNAEGTVAETVTGIHGFTQFNNPLDIVEDPATGNLYVSEFGGQKLTLLKPVEGKSSGFWKTSSTTPPAQHMPAM